MPQNSDTSAGMEICPDCGARVPVSDLPGHAYLGASPGCWAVYGEVLAREYSDARYFAVHQLTVDAYAAQHPGKPERRSIQSVGVHLVALYQALELDFSPAQIVAARKASASNRAFVWLDPPPPGDGTLTINDVVTASDPEEHRQVVRAWAESVWRHWAPHHAQVRAWSAALS